MGGRRAGHGMGMGVGVAGESSRCEDPAPTVGRLRGYHCDPNVAIAASMRIPYHNMESHGFYNRRGTVRAGARSARHRPYREHHLKPRNG